MRAHGARDVALGASILMTSAPMSASSRPQYAGQHVADLDDADAGQRTAHDSWCASSATTSSSGMSAVNTAATPISRSTSWSARGMVHDEDLDVARLQRAQLRQHVGDQLLVAARQNAQAHRVHALIDRHLGDLQRGAAQSGVDHLGARIAQRQRDDLGANVVPVQSGLADQDALCGQGPLVFNSFIDSRFLEFAHWFFRQLTISPTCVGMAAVDR